MNATSTACPVQSNTTSQVFNLVAEPTALKMHELQFFGGGNGVDNLG